MSESTQHVLDRVRSPRVQITYDVEIGGAIVMKELPYVIGVLADLSGMPTDPPPPMKFRKFVEVDRDNLPHFMVSINPRLAIQVKDKLSDGSGDLSAELFFQHMDDFGPISIAKQTPKLNKIYQSRIKLNDLVAKMEGNDPLQQCIKEIAADASLKTLLKSQIDAVVKANKQTVTADGTAAPAGDANAAQQAAPAAAATPPAGGNGGDSGAPAGQREILKEMFIDGKLAKEPSAEIYACNMLLELLLYMDNSKVTEIKNPLVFVEKIIADIDILLSDQINEILHNPAFQELEGTWRALHYLIMNSETSSTLKIRIMNATKKDLLDDLENAVEFDQSQLFKKVYEEEYGTFGGHPYSCLIGGYEFGRHPQDIELLEKISNVAAAAHAPFIAAAHPKMFDMDSFAQLAGP
ncbi:MAG: type VI secretion system contractile sheath small subunit, partial [Holosporaceae bacterium]|nr:type VI secretion system contractile sheath small subunit [Holosporaceae bacterium]